MAGRCEGATMATVPDPRHGVLDTLLFIDGHPVELDAHLERLNASFAELFPEGETSDLADLIRSEARDILRGSLRATVAPNGDALRVDIAGRERAIGPFVSLSGRKEPTLRSIPVPGGLGAHKWADRSLLDQAQARLSAGSLPLLLDEDGSVLEASRANVFAVRGGVLFTPPLDGRILPGITRGRVLEIAE